MDRFQAMGVFVKVAESGNFAHAARRLSLSPAAATRAVASLEAAIGARLLTRTTRRVKLTDVGERYLDDCRRILSDLAEAEAGAAGSHARPTGLLTVTAPVMFGRIYMLPILTNYLSRYPAVDGRALFLDRMVNLVDEGVDVAVRIGPLADSGLAAVRCGTVRRVVCASPGYVAAYGVPKTPGDLARHRLIAITHDGAAGWRFKGDRRKAVTVKPRLACNVNEAAISAAIDGWGLTRVLSYQVAEAIRDGRLTVILTPFEPEPLPIHVVHVEGPGAAAKVRSFVDFAVDQIRTNALIN
ncbi:LysR family transcriptional regulator [Hansschlegelia plantiphila]|uniref:LysR family transcriptional regulator n=1 Tax=Hansschlegelia plantiphila TaxID=374655 RepID=A0A9W6IZN9_9HYPH|nr:LysR family transcriptional regulator [Hansschlegelia plantiphila]GLK67627.1 LysR family transcriptional regulator [Hansschlegelia plantiphila]